MYPQFSSSYWVVAKGSWCMIPPLFRFMTLCMMLTLAGETPWWRCCGVKMRADFFGSKVDQKQASLKNNFVESYLQDPTNSTISLDEPRPPTARLRRKVANILIWLSSPVQGPWEQIASYLVHLVNQKTLCSHQKHTMVFGSLNEPKRSKDSCVGCKTDESYRLFLVSV
jgi:hypothetical protein